MNRSNDEADNLLRMASQDRAILRHIVDAPDVELAGVCFHVQQCVENALKAVLAAHGLPFERTRNLVRLARVAVDVGMVPSVTVEAPSMLNPCAVAYRYGDMELPRINRGEVVDIADRMLTWAQAQPPASQ